MKTQQLYEEKTGLIQYELSTGSKASRKTYNSIINNFLSWCTDAGVNEVDDTNYYHILNQYKTHLQERPTTYKTRDGNTTTTNKHLSPYTINQYMKKLLYFLRYCGIETTKEPKQYRGAYTPKDRKWITIQEYNQLLEYTNNNRTRIIMELMFKCGLRVNEVVTLTVNQYMNGQETPNGEYRTIKIIGKGNKKRQIPIPVDVCSLIDEYLTNEHPGTSYLIASTRRGRDTPLSTNQIRSILKKVCQRCDHIEHTKFSQKVTPHALRHSYAKYLLRRGVPVNIVQNLLGHSNLGVTSIYVQMDSETAVNEFETFHVF